MTWHLHIGASARGGSGGWAWRALDPDGRPHQDAGAEPGASAWRMRLRGAAEGLAALPAGADVVVHTTDDTTIQLATSWIEGWARRGWRKADGKPVDEADVVAALHAALTARRVRWTSVARTDPHHKAAHDAARAALDALPAGAGSALGSASGPGGAVAPTDRPLLAYTDGGCRGNPGPGGWGSVLVHVPTGTTRIARGGEPHTTNNRMELMGILRTLEALSRPSAVEIRTDSKFCIDALTKWMPGWKRKGWKKADKEPPANLDVLQALDTALADHDVRFTWVPGHAGEPGNELADRLTNEAMDALAAGRDPESLVRAETAPFRIGG